MQVSNASKKDSRGMLEIKNTIVKVKNAVDGLISRLGTAEERIRALDDRSTKASQMEMQRTRT